MKLIDTMEKWMYLLLLSLLLGPPQSVSCHNTRRTLQQSGTVLVVDQSGQGQFTTVQAAVDAVGQGPATIQIHAGTYVERVTVPATKPYLTFQGAGASVTTIQYNLNAGDLGSDGQPLTSYNAASVSIYASNFVAMDITFQNTQPPPAPGMNGDQAPALRISGDMASFYRCSFLGAQDTLCDDAGRHYFEWCFIQGSIDYIFGNGRSLYSNCQLNSIAQGFGSIAAQDRQSADEDTGFSFVNCNITGTGPLYLGRAMGPYSRIVFAYSSMQGIVDPRGWDDWNNDTSRDQTVFFAQYQCYGPGADESGRVWYSHELTDTQAQPFLAATYVDGANWLPNV